jgi:hypothetical protein
MLNAKAVGSWSTATSQWLPRVGGRSQIRVHRSCSATASLFCTRPQLLRTSDVVLSSSIVRCKSTYEQFSLRVKQLKCRKQSGTSTFSYPILSSSEDMPTMVAIECLIDGSDRTPTQISRHVQVRSWLAVLGRICLRLRPNPSRMRLQGTGPAKSEI